MWNWGLINGAADASDDAALHTLGYVAYFGWAGMGIGLATAFLAIGLGGIRNAVLPEVVRDPHLVLGVLGALGNAGIPPGGLVNYVLLPFWLIAASIVIARSHRRADRNQANTCPQPRSQRRNPEVPGGADENPPPRSPRSVRSTSRRIITVKESAGRCCGRPQGVGHVGVLDAAPGCADRKYSARGLETMCGRRDRPTDF